MLAYNTTDLYSQEVHRQASEAFHTKVISEESYRNILKSHSNNLYTPNYFIRLALGALTVVAVFALIILSVLFFEIDDDDTITILLLFAGIGCYGILELMVKYKKYYNAGVDNVVMICSLLFTISTFFVYNTTHYILVAGVTTVFSLWLCIRFADAFMASVAYLAFFVFIFLLYVELGELAKSTSPLLMMFVSIIVCYLLTKTGKNEKIMLYRFCINTARFLTLITLYASSNYFVVKELSNQMFSLNLSMHDSIPLSWLFWILTIIIPPAYVLYGVAKKDFLFIRTGIGLVAATVITIRYYHTLLPVETFMLIGGLILIATSYFLIQYLKTPKYGYTFQNLHPSDKNILNTEALIIAQTFGSGPKTESNSLYGGGSGSGGGASGDF